jgi:hypothetical protein
MRPLLAVVLVACGAAGQGSNVTAPAGVAGYPATRWVPAAPSFVLAAPTVRDAQRGFRDAIDAIGAPYGAGADQAGASLARMLGGVDPLSEKAVTDIGVDPAGGFAMFSESVQPTIAVHLTAPDLLQHFFDEQRQRGMVTQSVIVDGVEVFTTTIDRDVQVSWAVVGAPDPWFLVHFKITELGDDGTTWLQHARAGGAGWTPAWNAAARLASQAAHPAVAGFGDLRAIAQTIVGRAPDMIACGQLFAPVSHVSLAIDADAGHAGARVAFELGDAAAAVKAKLLAPPPGWAAAVAGSPVAVQWNLDLGALVAWLMPCARTVGFGDDLAALTSVGVRAARFALRAYDPDSFDNVAGAAAADLSDPRTINQLLDRVPMRKHLESDRTFGGLPGHSLHVPMVGRIDYVLTDHLVIVAKQDGLLDKIAMPGNAAAPPLVSLEIAPPALSPQAWAALLNMVVPGGLTHPEAAAQQLLRWRDAHVSLAIDGTSLVLDTSGDRR